MSCVRASSPVAAVMFGGVLRVRIGSTITLLGIMERWRRLTFTLASGIAITAFWVTSAPVPAVGYGDHRSRWLVKRGSISDDFEVGSEGVSIGEHCKGFAHVDDAPSAHGNNRAAAFLPSNLGESLKVIVRWVLP